jgi:hypothetical protein
MVVDDMMFVMGGGVMKKTISAPTREVTQLLALFFGIWFTVHRYRSKMTM